MNGEENRNIHTKEEDCNVFAKETDCEGTITTEERLREK